MIDSQPLESHGLLENVTCRPCPGLEGVQREVGTAWSTEGIVGVTVACECVRMHVSHVGPDGRAMSCNGGDLV